MTKPTSPPTSSGRKSLTFAQSGVMNKIEKLPNGVNTLLTKEFDDEGASLSGGETQKLAIARLFAKKFDVAVLDEPSSALDPVAESKMYDALAEGTKDKTVLYISHRLSSASNADRILVFREGKLIETGSHQQLSILPYLSDFAIAYFLGSAFLSVVMS